MKLASCKSAYVSLLLSIVPYNVSRFLGINFMDAYDVF